MNIPSSAIASLGIVYALHRMIQTPTYISDDFLSFGVLMVLGFAGICCYIVKAANNDRQRFNGMRF